jgi:hypothetical protein
MTTTAAYDAASRNHVKVKFVRTPDPDCLGCWHWYCPCHPELEDRGPGRAILAAVALHVTKCHPPGSIVVLR